MNVTRIITGAMHVVVATSLCLFAMLTSAQTAPSSAERRYLLSDGGYLVLAVPTNWGEQVRTPGPKSPPTITYVARSGPAFVVIVTPIFPMGRDAPKLTREGIRQSVVKASEEAKGQAVEKPIDVVELHGAAVQGYYFKVTDRAPKVNEYKYMAQGILAGGEIRITFTILTNDGQDSIVNTALAMLRDARILAR